MTDYAAGVKAYRTPEIIQSELDAQRAQTARNQQLTDLGSYQLKDLQALAGLSQPQTGMGQVPQTGQVGMQQLQVPSFQNLTGIAALGDTASTQDYLQLGRDQQQFTELQSKLQSAQQKYDAITFDPELKQRYKTNVDDIKKELTTAQEKQAKKQEEITKQIYAPILAAYDTGSWLMGRAPLAKESANAVAAKAIQDKKPEAEVERLRAEAYRAAYDAYPSTYNETARNIQANVQQQLEGSEGRLKEQKEDSDYAKNQLTMWETDQKTKKLKVETEKLQAELLAGKDGKDKLLEKRGKYLNQANTSFDNVGKANDTIAKLEDEYKLLKTETKPYAFGILGGASSEQATKLTQYEDAIKVATANRDKQQRDFNFAEAQQILVEQQMEAKGMPIPKEEPPPNLEAQRKQIQQEFNKYIPSAVAKQEGITLEQFARNYLAAAAKKGKTDVTIEEIIRKATQGETPLFFLKQVRKESKSSGDKVKSATYTGPFAKEAALYGYTGEDSEKTAALWLAKTRRKNVGQIVGGITEEAGRIVARPAVAVGTRAFTGGGPGYSSYGESLEK